MIRNKNMLRAHKKDTKVYLYLNDVYSVEEVQLLPHDGSKTRIIDCTAPQITAAQIEDIEVCLGATDPDFHTEEVDILRSILATVKPS